MDDPNELHSLRVAFFDRVERKPVIKWSSALLRAVVAAIELDCARGCLECLPRDVVRTSGDASLRLIK